MSRGFPIPGADFSSIAVASEFPVSSAILGDWVFGGTEEASQRNRFTKADDIFTGDPGFETDHAQLGIAGGLQSSIVPAGSYSFVYIGELPIVAGESAYIVGAYSTAGGVGNDGIFLYDNRITHVFNNGTRGTINRASAADGVMAGVRVVVATYDGEDTGLYVSDGASVLSSVFPGVGANSGAWPFRCGGRTTDSLVGGFRAYGAKAYDRALTASEITNKVIPHIREEWAGSDVIVI